uniref:t-SNARE coiled-coil homology domain-containing protein n=1 Tax=Amphora coffeiformis TaxID=265554 RepID=A0A7S3P3R1_9STRA|mmetsp:Transcript_3383/g.6480  ORF Transcript_3383/g.6480 Transcript_3383/m.6480 type:complete len:298 (-) Transcript_3383:2-895(-)
MSYTPLDDLNRGNLRTVPSASEDEEQSHRSSSRRDNGTRSALAEPLTANGQASEDPFYVFREDLYRKLEHVDESLAEFLRIVHQTDTSVNTHELKEAKKKLKRSIKTAESTLKDVQMTVQVIENDRQKFQDISDGELYERRSLVHSSRDRLNKTKEEMASEAVKAKMLADERAKAIRRAGADSLGATNDTQRMNTSFIVDSQARTSLLMQHQDETLDELDAAVERVGNIAGNIHAEIGQQNKMLEEMDDDLANVEEELGMVMGKLGKFLQTRDRGQICIILGLTATALVLFLMLAYF